MISVRFYQKGKGNAPDTLFGRTPFFIAQAIKSSGNWASQRTFPDSSRLDSLCADCDCWLNDVHVLPGRTEHGASRYLWPDYLSLLYGCLDRVYPTKAS